MANENIPRCEICSKLIIKTPERRLADTWTVITISVNLRVSLNLKFRSRKLENQRCFQNTLKHLRWSKTKQLHLLLLTGF